MSWCRSVDIYHMKLPNVYLGPLNAPQGSTSRNSSVSVIFTNVHLGEVNIATNTINATGRLNTLDSVLFPP
jgi:hypothetical protein